MSDELLEGYLNWGRDPKPYYTAVLENGSPLPNWIKFDPILRKFDLKPRDPNAVGRWNISVILTLDKLVHSENTW